MIFTGVLIATLAKAFPEKTFFLTTKPLVVSGNPTAPDTNPAFKRMESLGAMAFPSTLFENTITSDPPD